MVFHSTYKIINYYGTKENSIGGRMFLGEKWDGTHFTTRVLLVL